MDRVEKPEQDIQDNLSGSDLRNRSWRLINAAQLDYRPKYIGEESPLNKTEKSPIDGLIRTPLGYYRLAEDTRDGTRVLLHSYERSQLEGVKRGGVVVLPELESKDYDVYGVSARKNVRGAIFRDDMNHDNRYLAECFQKDLNLHAEDLTPEPGESNENPRRVIKLANGQVAFGIFETEDGKWKVRAYNNYRKEWDRAARFAGVDETVPKGFTGRVLSLGEDIKDFDSYDEAFEHVRRYWNVAALRLFKGKSLPFEPKAYKGFKRLKIALYSSVFSFWDQKKYRDWGVAVPVGVAAGFASTLVSGTPILGAVFGLGASTVWALGSKWVENYIADKLRQRHDVADRQEYQKLAPYFERNVIGKYLSSDPTTEKRFRKKVDNDLIPHLRLLNHDESDINYDDGEVTPDQNIMKDFERVSTAPYRYFGAVFDTTHHDKGVLTAIFPNGLVKLTHVDLDTRATRHYLIYRDDFNEIKGDRKHLDPKLTRLPGAGPVHKVTHRQGKDFRYASLTPEEFMADVMQKIGFEFKDYTAFGVKISDLFNVNSAETIQPKDYESQPVEVLLPQKPAPIKALS